MENCEVVFTPAALLDILSKIDELAEYDLGLTETLEGDLQLQVGSSIYELGDMESADKITVDDEVVDEIADINETAYSELVEDREFENNLDAVESGLIKEALKTLLIGGVVRLAKGYLKN